MLAPGAAKDADADDLFSSLAFLLLPPAVQIGHCFPSHPTLPLKDDHEPPNPPPARRQLKQTEPSRITPIMALPEEPLVQG